MAFKVRGQMVARALQDYRGRWDSTVTRDLGNVLLDFRLDGYVDALCLRLADDPDLPLGSERAEIRALLSARILVLMANAIVDPHADFLSCPSEPSAKILVSAVFRQLLASARLPAEWDGQGYRTALEEIGMRPASRPNTT